MSLDRLRDKQDGKITGPAGTPRPRRPDTTETTTVAKPERRRHDGPVMKAAKYFVTLAEQEHLQLARGATIIYYDLDARVRASGLMKLDLAYPSGAKVAWGDVLMAMIEQFFEAEYRHGDKWCWQEFCGVETFGRLQDYVIWRAKQSQHKAEHDARSARMNAELEAGWQEIEAAMRSANEQRHRDNDGGEVPLAPVPSVEKTAEDLFGDDLEAYQQQRARRQRKLEQKVARQARSNQRRATEEGE
jgi:hypothetical protein